jgi:hypothetical protein
MIEGLKVRMVRPGGFELPTFWFVARRSIQLSYGRTVRETLLIIYGQAPSSNGDFGLFIPSRGRRNARKTAR